MNNDDFRIVDFEGEHTKTASIGGMLFIDEGGQTALARDAGEPVLDLDAVLPEDMPGLPITLLGPELTSPPRPALPAVKACTRSAICGRVPTSSTSMSRR